MELSDRVRVIVRPGLESAQVTTGHAIEQVEALLVQRRPVSRAESVADAVVHGVGLLIALVAGSVLITIAAIETAPDEIAPLALYVGSLTGLLAISMAFNMCPLGRAKDWLARFDQAAIFLFIAATYTPLLAAAGSAPVTDMLIVLIWAGAVAGIALKLLVPHRFGRVAILLYLAIGWSGVAAFQVLAEALPPLALWLIVAGGVVYSAGLVFHLWERLAFQNAVWHGFVVVGAVLHLIAVYDAIVISRF